MSSRCRQRCNIARQRNIADNKWPTNISSTAAATTRARTRTVTATIKTTNVQRGSERTAAFATHIQIQHFTRSNRNCTLRAATRATRACSASCATRT